MGIFADIFYILRLYGRQILHRTKGSLVQRELSRSD